jgi:glycerol uptake facilitator-like aquaporin
MIALLEEFGALARDFSSMIPPGLIPAIATAFLEGGAYLVPFRHEFVGTLLMIVCTFSAGKWIGVTDWYVAWASHFLGVIVADYLAGGPHVNPAVTISMWTLGKCSYTEAYVRIMAQMAGGLVAFPLYHSLSETMKLNPFGGPEYTMKSDQDLAIDAFVSEFCAMFLLMFLIYLVNWEFHFGSLHYIIKQSLTAIGIRALIELFPTAGPAINPMLATTWNVFGVSPQNEFPHQFAHYYVYWVANCLSAILASIVYVVYAGGTIFGMPLPLGPLKRMPTQSNAKASSKQKIKKT